MHERQHTDRAFLNSRIKKRKKLEESVKIIKESVNKYYLKEFTSYLLPQSREGGGPVGQMFF